MTYNFFITKLSTIYRQNYSNVLDMFNMKRTFEIAIDIYCSKWTEKKNALHYILVL